ncbi:hypothetical protein BDB01DRAFT_791605 [Pilobolus umbonatus]|nr:hypothetical protein BDB01DRAFT_791605 [Pilobolus umbonatus]
MSHQSGIQVSEDLSKLFTEAVSQGDIRIVCMSIEKESVIQSGTTPVESTFEADYKHVTGYLDSTKPAYLFVRLDQKNNAGEYEWLFLTYVPDHAKIRDKMIYASTRTSLLRELGDNRFVDSIFGTDQSEFTWEGYQKHLKHKSAAAPLTRREQELSEIKAAEAKAVTDYDGTTGRKSYVPGVSFPFTEQAMEAISELAKDKEDRTSNFVSLCLIKEQLEVDRSGNVPVDELKKEISSTSPRFTFYLLEEDKDYLVFIYTCPSGSKIRERMLYSSSKLGVITTAENSCNIKIVKKYETSDVSDLTREYLMDDLVTPPTTSIVGDRINMLGGTKQAFKRPMAPGRRRNTPQVDP